ncbi:MAG: mechanosensitive ion channel family protein [Cyclobacteriaceae bacterium]
METTEFLYKKGLELAVYYGPRIIGALLILFIGFKFVKLFTNRLNKILIKQSLDESIPPFLKSLINITLKITVILMAVTLLGVSMASIIALLGAAGFAIGLALSGTLQNFAGGIIILVIKPFKVKDVIEAQGHIGTVKEIQVFNTYLITLDNRTVIIPNGPLANGVIINYTKEGFRRIVTTYGIGYGDNTTKAKEILLQLLDKQPLIINHPDKPFVAVSELADSSVNFTVRAWVKASDYFTVLFDLNEQVYNTFNKEGLNIPFPQMDIHLHKED